MSEVPLYSHAASVGLIGSMTIHMWVVQDTPLQSALATHNVRKVDVRLPGKRNSSSHGARLVNAEHACEVPKNGSNVCRLRASALES